MDGSTTQEEEPRTEGGDARPEIVDDAGTDEVMEAILRDPRRKATLLQRMGLAEPERQSGSRSHLTPSGKAIGGWGYLPAPFWPFPPAPYWFPGGACYCGQPHGTARRSAALRIPSPAPTTWSETDEAPCSSASVKRSREEDEDSIHLLDESEALELVEFDPSVEPKDSWEPPKAIAGFLEKHFNSGLEDSEKEAILKDFPKPSCKAVAAPKLDDEVKEQLRRKGRDPHFGSEKTLFKIQEMVLEVPGPLTCLWADLLNKQANITPEDTLLLGAEGTGTSGKYISHHLPGAEEDCLGSHQPQIEIHGNGGVQGERIKLVWSGVSGEGLQAPGGRVHSR